MWKIFVEMGRECCVVELIKRYRCSYYRTAAVLPCRQIIINSTRRKNLNSHTGLVRLNWDEATHLSDTVYKNVRALSSNSVILHWWQDLGYIQNLFILKFGVPNCDKFIVKCLDVQYYSVILCYIMTAKQFIWIFRTTWTPGGPTVNTGSRETVVSIESLALA